MQHNNVYLENISYDLSCFSYFNFICMASKLFSGVFYFRDVVVANFDVMSIIQKSL